MRCKWTHNVYITKLIEPEVVNRVGHGHKVTFAELLVGLRGGDVELVQDPFSRRDSRCQWAMLPEERKVRRIAIFKRREKQTLGVGSGLNVSSSFNMANLVALKILLQNLR